MQTPAVAELEARVAALSARGVATPALWRAAALLRRLPGQDVAVAEALRLRVVELLATCEPPAMPVAVPPARAAVFAELLQLLAAGRATSLPMHDDAVVDASALQPSPLLEEARLAWRTVRARSQLQQALAQPQEHAGPLNSSRLLLRALEAMQAVSPAYVECFLAHLDVLAALQPLTAAPQRASLASSRRPSRPRKRRD